jgi:hypothetical protein
MGRFLDLLFGVSFPAIQTVHCNKRKSYTKELVGTGWLGIALMSKSDDILSKD